MSNLSDFLFPKATEAQARAGTSSNVLMTPLTTAMAIDEQLPNVFSIGDVVITARSLPSPTYLPADGSLYLQASYAELFAEIGLVPGQPEWSALDVGLPVSAITHRASGNGRLVFASGRSLAVSENGVTWTIEPVPLASGNAQFLGYVNGEFVLTTNSGDLATSTDGETWSIYPGVVTSALFFRAATHDGTKYIAASINGMNRVLWQSTDKATWTVVSTTGDLAVTETFADMEYGNGVIVAVGNSGLIAVSTNGSAWSRVVHPHPANHFGRVVYRNGNFFAMYRIPGETCFLASADGYNWSRVDSPFPGLPYDITWTGTKYLIAGDDSGVGKVFSSSDLINWVDEGLLGAPTARSILHKGGMTVVGDSQGKLHASFPYDLNSFFMIPSVEMPEGVQAYIKAK